MNTKYKFQCLKVYLSLCDLIIGRQLSNAEAEILSHIEGTFENEFILHCLQSTGKAEHCKHISSVPLFELCVNVMPKLFPIET